ncbi:MAG: hypothetical protein HDR94_08095 [Bacteroides sp.]|nr:hypothetical protein [Bacteroides sp.]
MIEVIENFECLESNIFTLTPLLVSFYKNMPLRKGNLLYAYLLFPLLLHPPFYTIKRINSRTKLSRIITDKDIMAGFQERFNYYRMLTNECIQYGIESNWLKLNASECSITVNQVYGIPKSNNLGKAFELASMLHKVFTKNIINTYMAFGIKEL